LFRLQFRAVVAPGLRFVAGLSLGPGRSAIAGESGTQASIAESLGKPSTSSLSK